MLKSNKLLSIGDTAKYLGVSLDTLRRWDATGKLRALRSPGGHRYYPRDAVERFNAELLSLAQLWAASKVAPQISESYYADTQDRFRARLDTMAALMVRNVETAPQAPLVTAIAGEIGNNSFDHNLGTWPDEPGVFFAYDLGKREIVLADRGVGIKATLMRVRPELRDDSEALEVALTEFISGRFPEQRGNGLKFVRNEATYNPIGVSLQSGTAKAIIEKESPKELKVTLADQFTRGVLARIEY